MRSGVAGFVCELLAIAPDSDEERVDGHGGIDGHLSAKLVLDLARLHSLGAVLADDLEQVCLLLVVVY